MSRHIALVFARLLELRDAPVLRFEHGRHLALHGLPVLAADSRVAHFAPLRAGRTLPPSLVTSRS